MRTLRLIGALSVAGALALAPAVAQADHGDSTSAQLELVGQVDIGLPGENITDVWAHGNYAYLGTFDDIACSLDYTGVYIVDIKDPTNPTKVGFIPAKPGTRNNDVKVTHIATKAFTGDILIVTNESCTSQFIPRLNSNGVSGNPGQGGISIWDVTNPLKPKTLKQNFLSFATHNTFTYQQGAKAYTLVVDDENVQDLTIVDTTKPQSPKVVTVTGQRDWPADIAEEFAPPAEVFLHDVWVQTNDDKVIAYLSYWDAGLVLLDITDPKNPVFLGDSEYSIPDPLSGKFPAGDGHVAVPNADGTRVLFGDEDFSAGALTSFTFNGTEVPAAEGSFTPPTYSLPGGTFGGPVHWTGGEGCTTSEFDRPATPGEVALIQRGTCFFQDKAEAAFALGYAGFIVANDAARGDALISMGARDAGPYPPIPGYFVGNSTGETMKAGVGGTITAAGIFDGYGYLRLLDTSDPTNITELDQFATEGVFANPPLTGDRTMHNVVVDGELAYISWYNEGLRVVDFSGDTLAEVAHWTAPDVSFWGVYVHTLPSGDTYVLGSDRNSGLMIFNTVP